MDVAEVSICRNREPVRGAHRAQTKHSAAIALAFNDAEASRTGSGRVDSQYAIWLGNHANGAAATEFMAAAEVWLEFSIAER